MRSGGLVLLALAAVLAGCGRTSDAGAGRGAPVAVSSATARVKPNAKPSDLGFPAFATKNTVRLAGVDAASDAAAAAFAAYPAAGPSSRPQAVVLADGRDWHAALVSSVLMGRPLRAPLLLSDGPGKLPAPTQKAVETLDPTGAKAAGGAQLIRVGAVPALARLKATDVRGSAPADLGRAVDAFSSATRDDTTDAVIVVSQDDPRFALPAAALSAKTGDPILFVSRTGVPAATRAALKTHAQPKIYVLGPSRVIAPAVTRQLRKLGTVKRFGAADPVRNAIAAARFSDGSFGWGITNPGHGFVIAPASIDPATAAGLAPLSVTGSYGPLLLNSAAGALDSPVRSYLSLLRPGYATDPVRGVYNRAWIVGDAKALSVGLQADVDSLLEIAPVSDSSQ